MTLPFCAYSDRINHAFAYASLHPVGHVRKGTRIPYITHPANVALILARYGRDDDTIVAAILHDVVEDCDAHSRETHIRQIEEKFGATVLATVLGVTHATHDAAGHTLDSAQKKDAYLAHLAEASERARWVCAADKLHNARAILSDLARSEDPATFWTRFNVGRDDTIRWYRRVYNRLVEVGFTGEILPELLDAVKMLEASP
jgi:(p)ppGpp synthase/HD superfamily hydrolase